MIRAFGRDLCGVKYTTVTSTAGRCSTTLVCAAEPSLHLSTCDDFEAPGNIGSSHKVSYRGDCDHALPSSTSDAPQHLDTTTPRHHDTSEPRNLGTSDLGTTLSISPSYFLSSERWTLPQAEHPANRRQTSDRPSHGVCKGSLGPSDLRAFGPRRECWVPILM
jgi:hypothetical protein